MSNLLPIYLRWNFYNTLYAGTILWSTQCKWTEIYLSLFSMNSRVEYVATSKSLSMNKESWNDHLFSAEHVHEKVQKSQMQNGVASIFHI